MPGKIVRLASSVLAVSALTGCGPRGDLTHALPDVREVSLDVDFADALRIVGDEAASEGKLTASFSVDDGADPALLEDITVDVAGAGDSYSVLSRMPAEREGLHLELTLTVPAGVDVNVADATIDDATVAGALGALTLVGQKGNLSFEGASAATEFDVGLFPGSASGDVEVAPGGYFGLSSANGAITLDLEVGDGGRASVSSSIGDFVLSAKLGEDTELRARARGGAIDLTLPESTGGELTATGTAVTITGHSFEGTDFTDLKLGDLDGGGSREIVLSATSTVVIR